MRNFSTWNNANITIITGEWLESLLAFLHTARHSYATKELARGLQTMRYKFCISPTVQLRDDNMPLDIVANTDSDRAGCHSTRKSTIGYAIQVLGTTVHFGSRTQATVAPSSAESEFYAIGTATTEALFLKNFLQEILCNRKINC